jgi:hypothetical protein
MELQAIAPRKIAMPPTPSLEALLRAPLDDVRQLGQLPARDEDPMQLLKGAKSPVAQLARTVEELVPMIESFRTPNNMRRLLWQRFTGEALEREVTYLHACQQLEATATRAKALMGRVELLRHGLMAEVSVTRAHEAWLNEVVALGQAALSPAHALARDAAAFARVPDYWSRFSRRVDNLNALQTTLQLSVQQLLLADTQAQTVMDRYSEMVTVLLPLWRQRMGFELFSKSLDAPTAESKKARTP